MLSRCSISVIRLLFLLIGCSSSPSASDSEDDPPPVLAACRSTPVVPAPLPAPDPFAQPRTVTFRKVLERDTPQVPGSSNFPSGVAVSPDGRWLISLGFSNSTVTLYDAATLDLVAGPVQAIDSVQVGLPHAVAVSPDGSFAVMAGRTGVIGFCLPSLELLFHPRIPGQGPARHVARDRVGGSYYVSAEGFNAEASNVARLTASGELQAFFDAQPATTAMSLTRDDKELLVLTDNGSRLVILRTPDLSLRLSIDLPLEFQGQVVVPLRGDDRAIIVGGAPAGGETSVRGPLMALPVDLASGAMGPLQVLSESAVGGLLGDGNEWADAGETTAIVPTFAGVVTIDTNLGTVTLHSAADLQRDTPPCCDIASYPSGDRVVFSSADFSINRRGSLIVYEVEERIAFPLD